VLDDDRAAAVPVSWADGKFRDGNDPEGAKRAAVDE